MQSAGSAGTVAAHAAQFVPKPAEVLGRRKAHLVCLLFGGHSMNALVLGGLLLDLAGLATLRVGDHEIRD